MSFFERYKAAVRAVGGNPYELIPVKIRTKQVERMPRYTMGDDGEVIDQLERQRMYEAMASL